MAYLRLRQLCLVARELEPTLRDLGRIFGLAICYRDGNVAKYGLVNALFPIGTSFLEVVAPTTPGTAAGCYLERRRGDGGYMSSWIATISSAADAMSRRSAFALPIRSVTRPIPGCSCTRGIVAGA